MPPPVILGKGAEGGKGVDGGRENGPVLPPDVTVWSILDQFNHIFVKICALRAICSTIGVFFANLC